GTGGHHLACAAAWIGTVICTGHGRKADHALKLKPDHPMGAGHCLRSSDSNTTKSAFAKS
ncbi:hypothetical protein, partial [Paracoccus siganidrum]|uniref:hypothetical protein n=1 Tax=Paracoccus siganidrum TaxID=1276757 RepID=UPI00197EDBDA